MTDAALREVRGPAVHGVQRGSVVVYDADAGLGTVRNSAGTWLFHCTTIADGSRSIDPGTAVGFEVRPGGPGRFEAFDITPIEG